MIHKINSQLSMRYGIRLNQFLRLRQNGLQQYANDDPIYYDNDLKIYDPATPQQEILIIIHLFLKLIITSNLELISLIHLIIKIKASYNRRINIYT